MDSPLMALRECTFSELGRLDSTFARGTLPESKHPFLVIRLSGAASNARDEIGVYSHAAAMVMAALEAWDPWAAVLDLSRFGYTWGDEMANVLSAPQRWYQAVYPIRAIFGAGEGAVPERFPLGLVVAEHNREPLATLASEYMHTELLMRESVEDVVGELDRKSVV